MADELKPCPFCGGSARIESNRDWHKLKGDCDDDCIFFEEEIMVVPAQPGHLLTLIADWNRRTFQHREPGMSTDRELLELAAKAAGIAPDLSKRNGAPSCNDGFDLVGNLVLDWHNGTKWNPLVDDGHALRLAVRLKLHIGLEANTVQAWESDNFGNFQSEVLAHRGEEAATRRAIVRAAAEIGRRMP